MMILLSGRSCRMRSKNARQAYRTVNGLLQDERHSRLEERVSLQERSKSLCRCSKTSKLGWISLQK